MKKWILAGAVLLLALAVTLTACDLLDESNDGDITGDEFAQYSPDGKSITINLNGGAPSRNMSRALSNGLAQINHNFFEVVFFYDPDGSSPSPSSQKVARTSWSRGEGAALSVYRGGVDGINYGSVDISGTLASTGSGTPDKGAAILFVGKKENGRHVLLAVGTLKSSENNDGSSTAAAPTVITSKTSKVTFEIVSLASAIKPSKTGLTASPVTSSFFTTPDSTSGSYDFNDTGSPPSYAGADAIDGDTTMDIGNGTNFIEQEYNKKLFPLFMLESNPSTNNADKHYAAKFTFQTADSSGVISSYSGTGIDHRISEYINGIIIPPAAAIPAGHKYVETTLPGFIVNGKKNQVNTNISSVVVNMVNNQTPGDLLRQEAYFRIKVPYWLSGMTSFTFNIPVFAMTDKVSDSDSTTPVLWVIQPGLERYYIDDGVDLGGAILLGIGDTSLIEIGFEFN